MDYWAGALLLERVLTIVSAGFNASYFLRALSRVWWDAGAAARAGRKVRSRRAAMALVVVINLALLAGALYPLAAARFALVSGRHGLEIVTMALPLAAALFMTALVVRSRK